MPWTYNISNMVEDEKDLFVFGQLTFSGSYATGGDSGSFVIGGNALGLPDWRPSASALHASLPPTFAALSLDGGYTGVMVPASAGSEAFKLKLSDPSSHTELAAAAYPNALAPSSGVAYHTLALRYRKNL